MPEDTEVAQQSPDLESPETVEAESSQEPETPKNQPPDHVPYAALREAREELRAAKEYTRQLQNQILSISQQQLEASRPRQPEPQIDPDIDAVVAPVIGKYLTPLQRELSEVKARETALLAERQASAAWDYVQANVPDLAELSNDISEYLASLPESRANKITSDPDLVIQTAELVRERKAAGKAVSNRVAKSDLKARAKGDEGAASVPQRSSNQVDWSKLSDADFDAMERKLGIRR